MITRAVSVLAALVAVLAAPFLLRPRDTGLERSAEGRVVVITPHHDTICTEFGRAFSRHMAEQTGRRVIVDWRIPGGTSEIARVLDSEFEAAFRNHWTSVLGREWNRDVAGGFSNPAADTPPGEQPTSPAAEAREEFLRSDVGVGIDVFFGGGVYDFEKQAARGYLVARDTTTTRFGPAEIARAHPDWFGDDTIPATVGGEVFHDRDFRWIGTCLSSFGIVYNRDSLERLRIEKPPTQWDDLGSPLLEGEIALADPTKSGSVAKAFEMLIQEKIQKAVAAARTVAPEPGEDGRASAIRQGWLDGLHLIQKIAANARYFTDDATKIPRDVAAGTSAAGMCIDFYGRTQAEALPAREGQPPRVAFVSPVGGTSISVDPIGLLRGAPHPELAHAFIEFVLSTEGQKLWNFRAGTPGGPLRESLRRLPIRRDLYTPEWLPEFADADVLPYENADAFVYHPEYTARMLNAIRFIIRVMCIDTHDELKDAWRRLVQAGFPERATAMFQDVEMVAYDKARDGIASVLASPDRMQEVALARRLGKQFRNNYRIAAEMADRGE